MAQAELIAGEATGRVSPWRDLREWMERVAELGELRTVGGATWQDDIATITALLDANDGAPCVVFDNIPGYPGQHRVIVNTNGRFVPVYPDLFNDPWWTSRPEFGQFIEIAKTGVPVSYEAPPSAAAGEVLAIHVIPEAMQRVLVEGIDPAEAVAEAHQKIVAIHERLEG